MTTFPITERFGHDYIRGNLFLDGRQVVATDQLTTLPNAEHEALQAYFGMNAVSVRDLFELRPHLVDTK